MKAITLLESLIVMGIIATLLGLSTLGLTQFRATIELQNSYADILTALQTQQNQARNAIGRTDGTAVPVLPDYFSIRFLDKDYEFTTCTRSGSRLTCNKDSNDFRSTQLSNIRISFPLECKSIAFARLTGDMVSIDENGVFNTTGECSISIIHNQTSSNKVINIDLAENNININ